jgi:D-tagatose-1,6-bisphosphate aldolase subunit GatZ/KbaZ
VAAVSASPPLGGPSHLRDVVRAQKRGEAQGVYSVCSAHPFVLEAAMLQARADDSVVLIEATSNQVNPDGGYTGRTPADFVRFVGERARSLDFPMSRVILGGDHLGPFPHQSLPAAVAMDKAREMVRQYVDAGYAKIHLDASMRLGDDPSGPLAAEVATERAADLCAVAEAAAARRPAGTAAPLYVIGTEVPVPGGEREATDHLEVTRRSDAERTLELTRQAFRTRGLEAAWERVFALVVQPGVEFGDAVVFEYDRARARDLAAFVESREGIVFEAHSTDYQTEEALRALVEDHFAVLKVGPALTFAFREAVFALEAIEREWLGPRKGMTLSRVREVLAQVMRASPDHWRGHYHGDPDEVRFAQEWSLSDRIRYYWPRPEVEAALGRLLANLSGSPPPPPLLSQYLPVQHAALARGREDALPPRLIHMKVMDVLSTYARACGSAPARSGERPAAPAAAARA